MHGQRQPGSTLRVYLPREPRRRGRDHMCSAPLSCPHPLCPKRQRSQSLPLSIYPLSCSYSIYYSLVLVVGGDNLAANNNVERVFMIVLLVAGSILYALVVSYILGTGWVESVLRGLEWLEASALTGVQRSTTRQQPRLCLMRAHRSRHSRPVLSRRPTTHSFPPRRCPTWLS